MSNLILPRVMKDKEYYIVSAVYLAKKDSTLFEFEDEEKNSNIQESFVYQIIDESFSPEAKEIILLHMSHNVCEPIICDSKKTVMEKVKLIANLMSERIPATT